MKKKMVSFIWLVVVIFLVSTIANGYPVKPIEVVVPYGAGGLSDSTGRIVVEYMKKYLDVPIVITNVTGAGGVVGSRKVLGAKADGYSLLWHHHSLLTAYLMGVADFSWDSFAPIAQILQTGSLMVVKSNSSWRSMDDIRDYARANPGRLKYGVNIGTGSHFGGISVEQAMGVDFTFIGGGGDSVRIPQLLRGDIDLCASGGLTKNYVEAGDLRPIAWLGEERIHAFPNIPTADEQGYAAKEVFAMGLYGPKGLPENVVTKLEEVLAKLAADHEFQQAIKDATMCRVQFKGTEEFRDYLLEEDSRLYKLARSAGILKPDK